MSLVISLKGKELVSLERRTLPISVCKTTCFFVYLAVGTVILQLFEPLYSLGNPISLELELGFDIICPKIMILFVCPVGHLFVEERSRGNKLHC